MALMIFISSTGLVLNKHYCQDQLKSVALFVDAKSCHSPKAMQSCPMHGSMDTDQNAPKKCCDDETEYVKIDQEQIYQHFEIDTNVSLVFLAAFAKTFLLEHPTNDQASLNYIHYRPPILVCDQPVVLQTFLC